MKVVAHPYGGRLSRLLACALALIAVTFLLQVVPHNHPSGHDEAACRLCQVAHLGVAPAVSLPSFSVPLVLLGLIAIFTLAAPTGFFFVHSPSRAPPSYHL